MWRNLTTNRPSPVRQCAIYVKKRQRLLYFWLRTILECSDLSNCPQDSIEGPQPNLDNNTMQAMQRLSASGKDLSYRPPKPSEAKAEKIKFLDKSGQLEDGSKFRVEVKTE